MADDERIIEITSNGEPIEVEFGNNVLPDALPVLPLRETVTFPDTLTPLAIGQDRSVELVNNVLAGNRMIAMVASKEPENENPGPDQLYTVGVAGTIARMMKMPDGTLRVLVQGSRRIKIDDYVRTTPYLVARIEEFPDLIEQSTELEALVRSVQASFNQIVENVPYLPEELMVAVANVDDPSALVHVIAGSLRLKTEEKQELLEEVDVSKRLRKLAQFLAREADVIAMGTKIQNQVQDEVDKSQREFFLRQQLKAIQDELGESDPDAAEAQSCANRSSRPTSPKKRAKPPTANSNDWSASRRRRRIRSHPQLSRVDHLAAVEQELRGQPRLEACAQSAGRRSLRHREGQRSPDRISGRAENEP